MKLRIEQIDLGNLLGAARRPGELSALKKFLTELRTKESAAAGDQDFHSVRGIKKESTRKKKMRPHLADRSGGEASHGWQSDVFGRSARVVAPGPTHSR